MSLLNKKIKFHSVRKNITKDIEKLFRTKQRENNIKKICLKVEKTLCLNYLHFYTRGKLKVNVGRSYLNVFFILFKKMHITYP